MAQIEDGVKVIPQDLEAERALLSAIMNDKDARMDVVGKINPDDFFVEEHKFVFQAVLDLFNENLINTDLIDLVLLQNKIAANGYKGSTIDIGYLAEIASNVVIAANADEYAKIIRDKSILRTIIKNTRATLQTCYSGDVPSDKILHEVETETFDLLSKRQANDYVHVSEVIDESLNRLEELWANKGKLTGVPTGFRELDKITSGLQANEMVLVAGRPAMGKSAYALNIVEHACIKNGVPTAIFTLEMGKDQITNRLISEYAMIEGSKMKDGSFSEEDFAKMMKASSIIRKAPLFIDDTPGISVAELRAKCRRLKLEHNIGLVVIDYLQLMEASSSKNHSRQEEVSEISRNIKAIARELKAPVIALSQLSRQCEQRPDKRPMLSDLRESGSIEQDADIVMFLYRDEYYNPDSEHKGEGEIIIAKNRSGSTGTVRVGFLKDFTKYVNPENNYTNEMFNKSNKQNDTTKNVGEEVISTSELNAYDDIPINDMEG